MVNSNGQANKETPPPAIKPDIKQTGIFRKNGCELSIFFVQGVSYNSPYVYGFTVVNKETLKDLDNDVEMIGAQIPRKTHEHLL